jgi:DNA-directed RNA polymerase specialized sigma24 family protein
VARFPNLRPVIFEVFALLNSQQASDETQSDGVSKLIATLQLRLKSRSPKVRIDADRTKIGADEYTYRPAGELWRLLVRHAEHSLPPASSEQSKISHFEQLVDELVAAFPERRRPLLVGVLLGESLNDIAELHGVTLHTVESTCEAAFRLLGGEFDCS